MRDGAATVGAAVLLVMVGIQACGSPESSLPPFAVRDSAGIEIVENGAPAVAPGTWRLSSEPDLVIAGGDEPASPPLYRVAGSVALSDGRIVVLNGTEPMVRWFTADGRFVAGAGRRGDGPGEFGASLTDLWPLAGDSVATWEHTPRRMHVFAPDGTHARSVVTELPPDLRPGAYPQVVGRSVDHLIGFLTSEEEPGVVGERSRGELTFLRYGADGSFQRRLMTVPGFEQFTAEIVWPGSDTPSRTLGRPPFARAGFNRVHPDGIFYGSADRFEIAFYDFEGRLTRLIRANRPLRAVTEQMIEAYVESRRRSAAASDAPSLQMQPALEDLPFPDSVPAYSRLRVDREGWLWVRSYPLPADTVWTWSVFDPSGRWITDVRASREMRVLDIGRDHLLALVEDEFDVERVVRFAIVGRGEG